MALASAREPTNFSISAILPNLHLTPSASPSPSNVLDQNSSESDDYIDVESEIEGNYRIDFAYHI